MKFTSGCKDRKEMDKLFMIENNTPRFRSNGTRCLTNSYGSTLTDHKPTLNKKEKNYGYF
jgi:hypothetical protein